MNLLRGVPVLCFALVFLVGCISQSEVQPPVDTTTANTVTTTSSVQSSGKNPSEPERTIRMRTEIFRIFEEEHEKFRYVKDITLTLKLQNFVEIELNNGGELVFTNMY